VTTSFKVHLLIGRSKFLDSSHAGKVSQMLTIRWPMHSTPASVSGFILPTPPHLSLPDTPKAPLQRVPVRSMIHVTSILQDSHLPTSLPHN
jgi:hypothetical protein